MNPLTQFKKILILPLLIALALVVGAVSARATPACGLSTVILALEHYPSGSLDLMCNESQQYRVVPQDDRAWRFGRICRPKHIPCWSSHRVAHASGSQPGHRHGGHDYRIRGIRPHLYSTRL